MTGVLEGQSTLDRLRKQRKPQAGNVAICTGRYKIAWAVLQSGLYVTDFNLVMYRMSAVQSPACMHLPCCTYSKLGISCLKTKPASTCIARTERLIENA